MLQKAIIYGREVEYDDEQFEIVKNSIDSEEYTDIEEYLHYIGDGSNITNPKGNILGFCMFMDFKGSHLDLKDFDSREMVKMDYMFAHTDLVHFDQYWNMQSVETAQGMFEGSKKLLLVDLSASNLCNLHQYANMFADCSSLTIVRLGLEEGTKYSCDVDVHDMFICCPHLVVVDFSRLRGVFCPNLCEVMLSDSFNSEFAIENHIQSSNTFVIGRDNGNKIFIHF